MLKEYIPLGKFKELCPVCNSWKSSTNRNNLSKGEGSCKCNSVNYAKFKKTKLAEVDCIDIEDNDIFKFTVLGNPGIKKNSQRIIMNGIRPSIAYELWAGQALYQIQAYINTFQEWKPLKGKIHMENHFYRNTTREADLSNLHEGIQDCLTMAGFWIDDSIIQSHDGSRKHYDKQNPRIEVIITKFNE